jgi:hypothetical protein
VNSSFGGHTRTAVSLLVDVADGVIVRDAEAVRLEVAVSVLDAVVVPVALGLAVALAVCTQHSEGVTEVWVDKNGRQG